MLKTENSNLKRKNNDLEGQTPENGDFEVFQKPKKSVTFSEKTETIKDKKVKKKRGKAA